MADVGEEKLQEVIKSVLSQFSIDSLKTEQLNMLKTLLQKSDCMAVLPTGYGKSLPYQMFIPLARELKKCSSELPLNLRKQVEDIDLASKIIVCCPLVALMQDQVKRLENISDLRVAYKGSSQESDQRIKNGEVDIVFASPETLVGDVEWRSNFQKLKVGTIVIDEFHTIATWGGDDIEGYQVFRRWFRYIGELRSIFPTPSLLALSATCTNKIRKRIVKVLALSPDKTQFLTISPNKTNIKVVVKKMDRNLESAMFWLVDSLESKLEQFPRTLVYGNSITDVSKLYNYVITEIPTCGKFVDMFHSEAPSETKNKIISALRENDSDTRLIFATSALGMGIDVVNCHSVILYGPPRTVVDLVQLVGRVGRDEEPAVAVLMFNTQNLRYTDPDVKQLCNVTT